MAQAMPRIGLNAGQCVSTSVQNRRHRFADPVMTISTARAVSPA
jgi:hypothetical protein